LVDAKAYNLYGHALVSNPLLYVAEAGLVAFFSYHALMALWLAIKNRGARSSRYAVLPNGPKRTTWTQRSLQAQGILILTFVVLHLVTFKYGAHYTITYGETEVRDLHKLVIETFQQPIYVAWYLLALFLLGLHLSHGVGSTFQTLGLNHPRYNPIIKVGSVLYAIIVSAGFISQPLYVYFLYRGS
jgi:succinate dehydrogenase / fumarate reductase cytochrome b subunit